MNDTPPTSHAGIPALALGDDFPPQTRAQWEAAARALLRDDDLDAALLTHLPEGFALHPLYRREDIAALPHLGTWPGRYPFARGHRPLTTPRHRWRLAQELTCATPEAFAACAREGIARGLDEVGVLLDAATRAGLDADRTGAIAVGRGGLSLATLDDLDRALDGVDLATTALFLHAGPRPLEVAALLFALAQRRGVPRAALRGGVATDPFGLRVRGEGLDASLDATYDDLAALTRAARATAPGLHTLVAAGTPYGDAGASATQELAFTITTLIAHLDALQTRGLAAHEVLPHVRLSLSLGSNLLVELAKLRAARLLVSKVATAYGVAPSAAKVHLHARTSRWNKSALDPHVNILRGTTEAFTAIVGGVDSLHIDAFDAPTGHTSAFSQRLAQSTQLVLAEECELTRVTDPLGGAYAVEALTDRVAREAWTIVQRVEGEGGMARALREGLPQREVSEVADAKISSLATRAARQVGVNVYPLVIAQRPNARDGEAIDGDARDGDARDEGAPSNAISEDVVAARRAELSRHRATRGDLTDALAAYRRALSEDATTRLDAARTALDGGATLGDLAAARRATAKDTPGAEPIEALPARRLAGDFEALRDAARAYGEAHGAPPRVFQANLGPSRRYRARADWTTGLFQVGGFEVIADTDFDDADALVAAVTEADISIVVLCADDARYDAELPALAERLHAAAPATHLLLAGHAGERERTWREAGIRTFVNAQSNLYELLEELLQAIGARS